MKLLDKISLKIKWLRTQPESVKARYIWGTSLVIFAIVALLWIGVFRKYERTASDNGKNQELIEAEEKLKNDFNNLKDKIKIPDIKLSPTPAPEASPEISSEVIPKVLK